VTAPVEFKVDTAALARSIEAGPGSAYYWIRTHLFESLKDHRTRWLREKGTQFGRAGKDSSAIKVWRINEAPKGAPRENWVVYNVAPEKRRAESAAAAAAALPKLRAEAFAGSRVLEVHEEGKDIASGAWMAIPIKTRPNTPRKWRAKYPNRELIALPGSKPGTLRLFERKRVKGARRAGVQARSKRKRVKRDRLTLRFILTRRIDMKPTLHFYDSWDRLASDRATDFARVADRIVKDIARGKLA